MFICTLLFAALDTSVNGFVSNSAVQNSFGVATKNHRCDAPRHATSSNRQRQQQVASLTVQQMGNKKATDAAEGRDRGNILQVLALALCVWFFSVPPEFRRAHFCSTNPCVANRASCHDCVTFSEWKSGIAEYYENGGGVHFDFSIDPATKEANKEALDGLLKR